MLTKILIWVYIHFLKQWYGFSKISTKLIYAQAYHETGNFTSKVFKQNKNPFGMRQAKIRKNYATGTNLGHATFSSLFNSVRDYFERQKNFRIDKTSDAKYINSTVNSNYAEDKLYKQKWENTFNTIQISPVIQNSNKIIGFLIIAFLVYMAFLLFRIYTEKKGSPKFKNSAQRFNTLKTA